MLEAGEALFDGLEVAEDVWSTNRIYVSVQTETGHQDEAGTLLRVDEGLVLGHSSADRSYLSLVSDGVVSPLFESPHRTQVEYIPGHDRFFVTEFVDDGTSARCHLVSASGASERIALADRCSISPDGDSIVFAESSERDTELSNFSLSDRSVKDLGQISGIFRPEYYSRLAIGADGNVLAVTHPPGEDTGTVFTSLFDSSGNLVYERECSGLGELLDSDTYLAVVGCDDGEGFTVELVTTTSSVVEVVAADEFDGAHFVQAGSSLWIELSGPTDQLVHVSLVDGTVDEILEAEQLITRGSQDDTVSVFAQSNNVLDNGAENWSVYSTQPGSSELVELGEFLPSTRWSEGRFLVDNGWDGTIYRVGLVDRSNSRIDTLLEWSSLNTEETTSDGTLLVTGAELPEDDQQIVAISPTGNVTSLDRGRGFGTLIDVGDLLYYTAFTDADREELEVRRVSLTAENASPETLWEDVSLVGLPWSP